MEVNAVYPWIFDWCGSVDGDGFNAVKCLVSQCGRRWTLPTELVGVVVWMTTASIARQCSLFAGWCLRVDVEFWCSSGGKRCSLSIEVIGVVM